MDHDEYEALILQEVGSLKLPHRFISLAVELTRQIRVLRERLRNSEAEKEQLYHELIKARNTLQQERLANMEKPSESFRLLQKAYEKEQALKRQNKPQLNRTKTNDQLMRNIRQKQFLEQKLQVLVQQLNNERDIKTTLIAKIKQIAGELEDIAQMQQESSIIAQLDDTEVRGVGVRRKSKNKGVSRTTLEKYPHNNNNTESLEEKC